MERSAAFRDGLVTPQSRGSQLAGAVAASGVAGRGARGRSTSARRPARRRRSSPPRCPGRAARRGGGRARAADLRANLARLRRDGVDRAAPTRSSCSREYDGTFDAVLLDAPCTGLGTLASRADLRWRRRRRRTSRGWRDLQRRLLARAAAAASRPAARSPTRSARSRAPRRSTSSTPPRSGGGWTLDDLGAAFPRFAHPRAAASCSPAAARPHERLLHRPPAPEARAGRDRSIRRLAAGCAGAQAPAARTEDA